MEYTKDANIYHAIYALDFLREHTDADPEVKLFTHIAIQMIIQMKSWKDMADHEECCGVTLYAFKEWEKRDFGGASKQLHGQFKTMMRDLEGWIARHQHAQGRVNTILGSI